MFWQKYLIIVAIVFIVYISLIVIIGEIRYRYLKKHQSEKEEKMLLTVDESIDKDFPDINVKFIDRFETIDYWEK